jgi:hypothetical protein
MELIIIVDGAIMLYKKCLEKLGFVENKDFALTVGSFIMLQQSRMVNQFIIHPEVPATFDIDGITELTPLIPTWNEKVIIHHPLVPAVIDVDGVTIITPEVLAYDEDVLVEEFFTLTAPTQLQLDETWKQVQLSESDISLLIGEYLKGKDLLRDPENDSINIVNGNIHSWSFKNIVQPTVDELVALIAPMNAKNTEDKRTSDLLALGKKSREACDKALDLISGHNQLTALTDIQITEMTTVFAPIVMALSVHKRPNLAKALITAIVPDEVTVTTQMKNDLLAILTIL